MYSAWKNEPADTNKNAHATSQQPLLSYYVIPVVWFQSLQVGSRSRLRSGCTHRCHDIMGRASNMSMQQEDTCKYAHRAKGSHGEVRTSPATNRENVSSDFANRNSNWLKSSESIGSMVVHNQLGGMKMHQRECKTLDSSFEDSGT